MLVFCILFLLFVIGFIGFAEETKIGNRFASWLLKKIDGSHFEHLE